MDNRYGLAADVQVLQADGLVERVAAVVIVTSIEGEHKVTVGADKGYDVKTFVEEMRNLNVTPMWRRKRGGQRYRRPNDEA